ncbi:UvrD-helicase domain-containing protein [Ferrimicrobium acidiphilum]|nr:UvrD-helicase domain-containing protein [Ferrimicrobium acidiphilum]
MTVTGLCEPGVDAIAMTQSGSMVQLSKRQHQAVTSRSDVAISAGAGTGKTQTMAARYLAHVEAGIRPLSIVAVTFTIRAAAELRHRILSQMRERYLANDSRVLEVEVAPIGTIHSLCQRICGEFPDESGIDFDFQVVDETSYQKLLTLEMPHLLERIPPHSYELLDYSTLKSFITDCLKDVERFRTAARVDISKIKESIRAAQRDAVDRGPWAAIEHELSQYQALRTSDRIELARLDALSGLRSLRQGDSRGWETLSQLNLRGGSANNWTAGEFDLVKEGLRGLRERIKELPEYVRIGWNDTDTEHQAAILALTEAVEIIVNQLVDLKARRHILDFNDLETHALKALANETVRAELADRWQAILVDEVQDISPIQYQILTSLGRDATLSAVGDAKQSLYRFRGADPELFSQQIAASQEHVTLDENYRTVPALVDSINAVFTELIPDYEPLNPVRTTKYARDPVEVIVVDETSDATMPRRRKVLAEQIGYRILDLLEEPFEVIDPETGMLRQAQPRDIAIISASWGMLDQVAEELQRLQLPANIVGGGPLLTTQEALDALTLLSFCANPHEDLACLALARSPMVGLSDAELAILGEEKPRSTSWFSFLVNHLGEDPRLLPISRLPFSPTFLPPSDQLAVAADLLLYPEIIARLNHPERRRADWTALLDLVDQRANEGLDTHDIVAYLRFAIDHEARIPRPPVDTDDSVSLVTIHASKGLEWPITIVTDLDRNPRRTPPLAVDPHFGIAYKLKDERSGHLSWIIEQQKEEELAEERRRWYVATTRARDHLILALASTDRVDQLLEQFAQQTEIVQVRIDATPAIPRVVPGADPPRYRMPEVDLATPSAAIKHELASRTLNDFRLCPLLLATPEAPRGVTSRLRALFLELAVEGRSISLGDLDWLPASQAESLIARAGEYQSMLSAHLVTAPELATGRATMAQWSIDWGPFLFDGTSVIDLTMTDGDVVGLSLAHADHPGIRAGVLYLAQSRIHWLSSTELATIHRELPPLMRELAAPPWGPRDDRASTCRYCRQTHSCHWVQSEDHKL